MSEFGFYYDMLALGGKIVALWATCSDILTRLDTYQPVQYSLRRYGDTLNCGYRNQKYTFFVLYEQEVEKINFLHSQTQRCKSDSANHAADQHLCFLCCIDSTNPLLLHPKSQIFFHLLWMYSLVCFGSGQKR